MKQKEFVIPEYCIGCGRAFDLWQHFLDKERTKADKEMIKENPLGSYEEFLCNECKHRFSIKDGALDVNDENEEYELVDEYLQEGDGTLLNRCA